MSAVTVHSDFGTQENKICHCSHFSPSVCHEVMGLNAMILVFWMLSFKPAFSLCSFTLIKRFFSFSSFSAFRVVSYVYLRLLIFLQKSWFQQVTIHSLDILLSQFWIRSFLNTHICCFLTCLQISQETDKVVWYSHFFKNCPQFLWSTQSKAFR